MKVKLINYTSDAKNLLLFTKNTRLMNEDNAYDKIKEWSEDKKQAELDYMLNTIKSSWEFVDYVFDIREVTRGFTHQFVRTRQGSYAQQSQRTVDMQGCGVNAEDARGILPTNIHTNIVAKFNLRTLHEMAKSRLSPRAQGEYREVFKLMVAEVIKVHDWAEPFLTPKEWSAPSMAKPLNKKV
jgi:thymidylate synthase ThyX